MGDETYINSIRTWRQVYTEDLLSLDGWLAISGLFWLEQGENRFGADPANRVVLPRGSGPAFAGIFVLHDKRVALQTADGIDVIYKDQPVTNAQIDINDYGSSEWIYLNDLKISVIQRRVRYGVRIYDKNHPILKQGVSLRWFPIQDAYCIHGRFEAFRQPQKLSVVNVLGDTLEIDSPGYAEFTLDGTACRLQSILVEETNQLRFMFLDATSGDVTFAGGRYLETDIPVDDRITLDFNKAHNPPCAYTDFATCPLPPPANRISVAVKAGELKFPKPIVTW